jgi:hypothetical protein
MPKKLNSFAALFRKKGGVDKDLDRRLTRLERQQRTILRLLQRAQPENAALCAPGFDTTGHSVYSQFGEDGHLLHIFRSIGAATRTFVEIGVQDGLECNAANLAFNFGWTGVLIEGDPEYAAAAQRHYCCLRGVTVKQAFVTRENVNALLQETGAQRECDLFSLDIDGNDYWIWEALRDFRPRVAVIEYNAAFGPERSVTIPYQADFRVRAKHPRLYHGASLTALTRLAAKKGCALVGCSDLGPNAFFVRRDCLRGALRETPPAEAWRPTHLKRHTAADVAALDGLEYVTVE